MKKNLTKLLSLSLLGLMLVGCSKPAEEQKQSFSYEDPETYIDENGVVTKGYEDVHVAKENLRFQGTHDFTYEKTSHALVKNGKTNYKVIIPENCASEIYTARDELIYFFKEATGAELTWAFDCDVEYTNESEFICLGENWFNKKAHITIDRLSLGADGCCIKTRGNALFLYGGSTTGTLNAVYDFLHLYFRLEVYSPDVYEIDRNVKNVALRYFDTKNIPDIAHRAENYGFLLNGNGDYNQSNIGYRLRMSKDRGHFFMPVFREFAPTGTNVKSTNTNTYIPYDMFSSSHPKWFSDKCASGKYQLCYTAHGDEEEYEALVEKVAEKIEISCSYFTPALYPDLNVITFTMEDNYNICECDACKAAEARYTVPSGALITFVNKVGDKVKEWMNKEENAAYKREGFKIIYFAYNQFVDAPITYNAETNEYTPICDDVKLRDNTGVYLAIIDRCDFQYNFFNNPINNGGKDQNMGVVETIRSWFTLTDSIWLWLYETNFGQFTYFYDSFNFFTQPFYDYIASTGVRMYFSQGQDTKASGCTGTNWNNLKAYLNSKLAWDSSLDQGVLIERYFNAMYGKASGAMREYFGLMRAHYAGLLEEYPELTVSRSIYNRLNKREYNPLTVLQSFVAAGEKAKALIRDEDYDSKTATILRNNIEAEIFCPMLHELTLYDMSLSVDSRREMAARLLQDVSDLRLQSFSDRENNGTLVEEIIKGYLA